MQVHICAVGKLRRGPELTLTDDYLDRFAKLGRNYGLSGARIFEIDPKKPGMTAEADLLRRAIPDGARIIALDERGKTLTSPDFSLRLADWRDTGCRDLAILIGGADGLDPGLRAQADLSLSLGTMVWPHMLVRVMIAEQLYRAATIMAGTPYHRV